MSEYISNNVQKEMEVELQPENAWETTTKFNPDGYAGIKKNIKVKPMKLIPKGIL